MFFSISSSGYHSNILEWLFLVQLLIVMMGLYVNLYCRSILGMFIFYSIFLEVEKHPKVTWSTSTCSKLWEVWDIPCLFHLSSWPSHSGKSQMDWTILDWAFPFHGEVMENDPCDHSFTYWNYDMVGHPDIPQVVSDRDWPVFNPAAANSPEDVWWTISRTNVILFSHVL